MSVKQVNLGNLQRKLYKRIWVSFAQDSLKCQNNERLVLERAKGLVIQWLSCTSIQKQIILLNNNNLIIICQFI